MNRYHALCEALLHSHDDRHDELLLVDYFRGAGDEDAEWALRLLAGWTLADCLRPRLEEAWCGATMLGPAARTNVNEAMQAVATAVVRSVPHQDAQGPYQLASWLEAILSRVTRLAVRCSHCAFWTLLPRGELFRLRRLFEGRPCVDAGVLARAYQTAVMAPMAA
jgi:hypothetical protein